ncbi:MAG: type III pantothenate kinase [Clostridia bacterium]|nr:type III pantothenate kinase [Clostridia bacterium]
MIFAASIGNERISVGFFEETSKALLFHFQISADPAKTTDEFLSLIRSIVREEGLSISSCSGAILSSVVPQLTATIREVLTRLTGTEPLVVGPGVKTGFSIKIDSPAELGGDIVANASAALATLQGKARPMIIVDAGTVTTVSAIHSSRAFLGCSIFPGVQISFDALHGRTAQLPNVMRSIPERAIGKNSQESIRAGVVLGQAMTIDGFVERFAREMKSNPSEVALVMTGNFAPLMLRASRYSFDYEEHLTLKGLCELYCNTVQDNND